MYSSETTIRIHYALTDQMGFVYYGHYAQFYEIGRAEAIRSVGLTYSEIEREGVIMPVGSMQCKYLKPARYDELITVKTILRELPQNSRITFQHEIMNEEKELINKGEVTLHFVDKKTLKGTEMPKSLKKALEKFF